MWVGQCAFIRKFQPRGDREEPEPSGEHLSEWLAITEDGCAVYYEQYHYVWVTGRSLLNICCNIILMVRIHMCKINYIIHVHVHVPS